MRRANGLCFVQKRGRLSFGLKNAPPVSKSFMYFCARALTKGRIFLDKRYLRIFFVQNL